MRHRTGDVGLTARATWASPPGRRRRSVHRSPKTASQHRFGAFVYTAAPREDRASDRGDAGVYTDWPKWPLRVVLGRLCTLLGCCAVVDRRGDAIVYTNGRIGPLLTGLGRLCTLLGCCAVVDRCEDAIVYTDRRKWPLRAVSGHLCTLVRRESRYESRRELPAPGGASASTATACRRRPLAGPSRLVGKTGSARVAPPRGWRLRRGVNPHEPPKSLRLRPANEPVSTDKTHPYAADCGT